MEPQVHTLPLCGPASPTRAGALWVWRPRHREALPLDLTFLRGRPPLFQVCCADARPGVSGDLTFMQSGPTSTVTWQRRDYVP